MVEKRIIAQRSTYSERRHVAVRIVQENRVWPYAVSRFDCATSTG